MPRYKHWITISGEKIPINKLGNTHLVNIIHFLKRKAQKEYDVTVQLAYSTDSMLTGEMASFYMDKDIEKLESEGPDAFLPDIYDDLIKEATKRELNYEAIGDVRSSHATSL